MLIFFYLFKEIIKEFYNSDLEQCGNELKLIAEAYYSNNEYTKAKRHYHLLLTNVKEFLVHLEVWLKYGNCCSYLGETEDAIYAYRNAVNLESANCEAVLSLVSVLKKHPAHYDEADFVLTKSKFFLMKDDYIF